MVTRTRLISTTTTTRRDEEDREELLVVSLLPRSLQIERCIKFDTEQFPLYECVVDMLSRAKTLGSFRDGTRLLEGFRRAGSLRSSHEALTSAVLSHEKFLSTYEALVTSLFPGQHYYYQYPPTVRIQPGPSESVGRTHSDADYGHRLSELNFWMPLTDYDLTQTALWIESEPGKADFHPIDLKYGEVLSWYGTACRHFAPANKTKHTRISLDFRIALRGEDISKSSPMIGPLRAHCRRN